MPTLPHCFESKKTDSQTVLSRTANGNPHGKAVHETASRLEDGIQGGDAHRRATPPDFAQRCTRPHVPPPGPVSTTDADLARSWHTCDTLDDVGGNGLDLPDRGGPVRHHNSSTDASDKLFDKFPQSG